MEGRESLVLSQYNFLNTQIYLFRINGYYVLAQVCVRSSVLQSFCLQWEIAIFFQLCNVALL